MTIHDREYYRGQGPGFLESLSMHGKVCTWLIAINVIVFLLEYVDRDQRNLIDALALSTDDVLHGQVWRLLTYAFLHDPFNLFHIVINMLFLWFFGSELEDLYGPREFLAFYLVSAVVSGVAFAGWQLVDGIHGRALGASGAVTAVMVLFALHFPHRQILFMFIIPLPIWLFVGFQVVQDTLRFLDHPALNQTAVTCHLGGALFGFIYQRAGVRLLSYWPSWRMPRMSPRPKLRVYREEEEAEPVSVAVPPSPRVDEQLEAQLDAILEKVGRTGKESLTEQERAILLRASEVYKRRRH